MVSVVVATDVHHQGLALEVSHFHARSQHRIGGHALGINGEAWQIAQVTIAPWGAMLLGVGWVEVPTGCASRDSLAVCLVRCAAAVGMHVEAMQARGQVLELRSEHDAILGFADLYGTDAGALSTAINPRFAPILPKSLVRNYIDSCTFIQ
jgi:hypothetical protein